MNITSEEYQFDMAILTGAAEKQQTVATRDAAIKRLKKKRAVK